MSRMPNGTNGYTNGHHRQESGNRYDGSNQDAGPPGGILQARVEGYGGFHNDSLPGSTPLQTDSVSDSRGDESESGASYWRRRPDRPDRERSGAGANGSQIYGDGPGGRQIEGVIRHIQDKWDIMTKDDCVTVYVALQLMDHSSLGRGNDYYDFTETNNRLQKGLKAIVNEHHQGFNSSIGTFHKIQSSIQASQNRVRVLKDSLFDAKANLTVTKPEIKEMAVTSQSYEEMLHVLGQIEKIQLLPEQLDARISEKQFLSAVDVLETALRLIRKSNLEDIGALADLRVYFSNQETSLTDILIEELHDHLYLKSPYCQDRWKTLNPSLDNRGDSGADEMSRLRPLYRFLTNLDTSVPMADNISQNPETDSFEYIHMIMESLNKMGRLEVAVERMEHRLPIELFGIVDRTNQEVDGRHPAHLRLHQNALKGRVMLDLDNDKGRSDVLGDLLGTLYSKFEAIAEGHRAVHAVVAGIIQREGLGASGHLLRGFKELWKLYQSEIRSLLHDYLATNGNPLYGSGQNSGMNNNIFQRATRDKSKRVFKLDQVDSTSTDIASEQQDLDKILQTSVPGLVSKFQGQVGRDSNNRNVIYDGPTTGHKLLVEPSVFNISVLLPPSLSFLQSLRDIVPPDSDIAISTLTSFLDDLLINVFHPQFEETVTDLCAQSFVRAESFQEDSHWSDHARNPIFKGTSTFFSLIKAFCKILDAIPQDQTFTQLIVTQLVNYYDRCCQWYTGLVTRAQVEGGVRLKTAAAIMEGGDVELAVKGLWSGDKLQEKDFIEKEIELLTTRTNETPLEPFDIISDRRSVASLCLMYTSMQWLASRLIQLRYVTPDRPKPGPLEASKGRQNRRWTLLKASKVKDEDHPVHLPMTKESVLAFDGIISSFRDLATKALLCLHVDIRCGVIHMVSRTLHAQYLLEQPANEPDPSILYLNADLLSFDENVTHFLPDQEHHFIITGLARLMDHILITNASQISVMNENGCGQMQLNILVLQQNLKSIEDDVTLARSAQFFEMFAEGADTIVLRAKETGGKDLGFNLEEMKALIELCHSEGVRSQQRDVATLARRALSDHLLQLSESMWNT